MKFPDIKGKIPHRMPGSFSRLPRRRLWLYGLIALLVGGGIWYFTSSGDGVTYRTETVQTGDLEQTVTALGSLQPKDYVDVGAQVSGELQVVHVEIGDVVKKGDLLAEVDPTIYAATVAADQAKVADLKSQVTGKEGELALAKIQLQRNQNLMKLNAISQDVLDVARTSVKTLTAQLVSVKAQLDQAEQTLKSDEANLSYTKIYAPMDGTVVSQTTLQGQTLNNRQAAPTILQIADLTTMTVKAQVAEADVTKLKVGMPVYFTTLGMPNRKWRSTVRQILPTPETVNDVILYNALIDVKNPDNLLLPSMTAQVFFLLGSASNVPLVPSAALRPSKKGGDNVYNVMLMRGSEPEPQKVEIGLMNRLFAEVVSGLKAGDVVVTGTENANADRSGGFGGSGSLGGRRR